MMQAVICTGGAGPAGLLEEMGIRNDATIIAADSGYTRACELGLKPAFAIGDFDSLDAGFLHEPGLKVIRHPEGKDYSDTELALRFMESRGCTEYLLLGGGEGRLDHALDICRVLGNFCRTYTVRWITRCEHIWFVHDAVLQLEAEAGTLISLYPVPGLPSPRMRASGLAWDIRYVHCSLSNRIVENACSITAESGVLMVMLPAGKVKHWSLIS